MDPTELRDSLWRAIQLIIVLIILASLVNMAISTTTDSNCDENNVLLANLPFGIFLFAVSAIWLYAIFAPKTQLTAGIQAGFTFCSILWYVFFFLFTIISIMPSYGCNPTAIMNKGLKWIHSHGYGLTTPAAFTFKAGEIVYAAELVTDIPIMRQEVGFACSGEICGKSIEVTASSIRAMQKIRAYAAVCGNEQRQSSPRYCIAVSDKPASATSACVSACGLE
jgi:hypothetical protein